MTSFDPENLLLTGGFQSNLAPKSTPSSHITSSASVRPITLKIASTVPQTGEGSDAAFIYQGNKLDTVRVVGKVEDIITRKKGVSYVINDGTGTMKVDQFVPNETDEDVTSPFSIGQYVILHAYLKKRENKDIVLSTRKIEPVVDYNVITKHLLEIMQSHLYHEGQLKGVVKTEQQ